MRPGTVRLLLATVLLFGCALREARSEDNRPSYTKPAALYLTLAGADLWSTEVALRAGGTEMNPAMRSARPAKKVAQVAALVILDRQLQKRSKWAARGARVLAVAVHVAIVRQNVKAARGER